MRPDGAARGGGAGAVSNRRAGRGPAERPCYPFIGAPSRRRLPRTPMACSILAMMATLPAAHGPVIEKPAWAEEPRRGRVEEEQAWREPCQLDWIVGETSGVFPPSPASARFVKGLAHGAAVHAACLFTNGRLCCATLICILLQSAAVRGGRVAVKARVEESRGRSFTRGILCLNGGSPLSGRRVTKPRLWNAGESAEIPGACVRHRTDRADRNRIPSLCRTPSPGSGDRAACACKSGSASAGFRGVIRRGW